jgi:hypothetical protein
MSLESATRQDRQPAFRAGVLDGRAQQGTQQNVTVQPLPRLEIAIKQKLEVTIIL